jgi:hypothetical protein
MQDSSIYRLVGQQTLFILLLDTPFQRTVPHPARLERTIACPTLDPQPAFVSKFVVVGRIRASYVHLATVQLDVKCAPTAGWVSACATPTQTRAQTSSIEQPSSSLEQCGL